MGLVMDIRKTVPAPAPPVRGRYAPSAVLDAARADGDLDGLLGAAPVHDQGQLVAGLLGLDGRPEVVGGGAPLAAGLDNAAARLQTRLGGGAAVRHLGD